MEDTTERIVDSKRVGSAMVISSSHFSTVCRKKSTQELMDFLEDTEVGRVVGTEEKEGGSEDE